MNRHKRILTPKETQIVEELYALKKAHKPFIAYVTAAEPIPMGDTNGKGPWGGNPARIIPAGQTLRVVMVSSMGDCGLTDDLNATHGYWVRLDWDSVMMTDIRRAPDPTRPVTQSKPRYILMGKAEAVDEMPTVIREMLENEGLYIGSDPSNPAGGEAPILSMGGKLFSMVVDSELDPTRFIEGTQIDGPLRASHPNDA